MTVVLGGKMALDVSVVIPTFRRPDLLDEAVRSALGQEGVSVEVIVVDDSPERSARGVVERLADRRVTYRARAVPSGGNPSAVRNDGWPSASGRFVHFLDDDDRVVPGAYRAAVERFEARPRAGVVFGRIEAFGRDPAAVERERRWFGVAARKAARYDRLGWRTLFVANQLFAGPTLHVNSACLIRREHLPSLGGYDEQIGVVEDLEFYVRAMRTFGVAFLDRPFVQYRTGGSSLMTAAMQEGDQVGAAYRRIYSKYRAAHGAPELLAMKLMGKTVLRWL